MKLLKFEHITFGYKKDKIILNDLSFEIRQPAGKGYVIGLMGISGCGKTTILKLILGIEKNQKGRILILPENAVISYVPQESVLFEQLTTLENAEYFNKISNYKSKFNRQLFNEIAKLLQIEDVLKNTTSIKEISGGQKQRISLLRALSIKPDILLLDEPLIGLDEEIKDKFLQTLAILIKKFQLMVIYVTHHRKEAEFISDDILYLETDKKSESIKIASQTKSKIFFNNPPTVSALNATKEIRVNTMYFGLFKDGNINPIASAVLLHEKNVFLMSFHENVIEFRNQDGFEFEVVAETGTFTILKLKGMDLVFNIDNETFKNKYNQTDKYISLSGNVFLYDNAGNFLRMAEINNNKILNP